MTTRPKRCFYSLSSCCCECFAVRFTFKCATAKKIYSRAICENFEWFVVVSKKVPLDFRLSTQMLIIAIEIKQAKSGWKLETTSNISLSGIELLSKYSVSSQHSRDSMPFKAYVVRTTYMRCFFINCEEIHAVAFVYLHVYRIYVHTDILWWIHAHVSLHRVCVYECFVPSVGCVCMSFKSRYKFFYVVNFTVFLTDLLLFLLLVPLWFDFHVVVVAAASYFTYISLCYIRFMHSKHIERVWMEYIYMYMYSRIYTHIQIALHMLRTRACWIRCVVCAGNLVFIWHGFCCKLNCVGCQFVLISCTVLTRTSGLQSVFDSFTSYTYISKVRFIIIYHIQQ